MFAKSHFIYDLKHSAAMGRWFRNMSIHCLQLWWCSSGSEPLPDGLKNLMCALVHRDIPVRCWTFTWEAWDPMRTGRLNTGWAPGNQLWYVEGAVDGKANLFDLFEDFSFWMGGCIWLLGCLREDPGHAWIFVNPNVLAVTHCAGHAVRPLMISCY